LSGDDQIRAVLVDLDDTLYPQADWLRGAWERVADVAHDCGIPGHALLRALNEECERGSDRGGVIDRALARIGVHDGPVQLLVAAFREHEATRLEPYPGVTDALERLRAYAPLGLVTDGDPRIQRSKLRSLRLADVFDVIVISDEYGRWRRKPDPYALLLAAAKLTTDPSACVYIGDRPTKDVAAAEAAGMRSVRVFTGEYAAAPDDPPAWRTAEDLPEAVRSLVRLMAGARSR
jgi:putative hydrolase of the HAD superfamily